jgi:hypothetical protein
LVKNEYYNNKKEKYMTNNSIAGKWKWHTVTYEFFNDGTYRYVNTGSGVVTNSKYAVSGNILIFTEMGCSSEIGFQGDRLTLSPIQNGVVHRNEAIFSRV